jgi:hypothetical protein
VSASGAPFARLVRAGSVSVWATLMAVAAHVAGSGEPPSLVALVPVVAAGTALAWWAASRRIAFGSALLLLAVPQLAVHALSGYVHGHQVLPSEPGMLLAHAVGVVLVAAGLSTADRLWTAWWRQVGFVLRLVERRAAPTPSLAPVGAVAPRLVSRLLDHVVVRRGPPRSWVVIAPVAGACR